jgi:rare lipoprotein A
MVNVPGLGFSRGWKSGFRELIVIAEKSASGRSDGGIVARVAVVAVAAMTLLACTQSEIVTEQASTVSKTSSRTANPTLAFGSFPESYFAPSTFSLPPSAMAYAAPASAGMRLASATSTPVLDPPATRLVAVKSSSYGVASFYRHDTHTASGERFDQRQLTAAHRTLPFGTHVRVTNLATGRSVTVRINDRGPFIPGRIVDLSYAAADQIGMVGRGVTKVKLDVLQEAEAREAVASIPR